MSKILLLFYLLVFQGCLYQSVTGEEIKLAEKLCKNHGGVKDVAIFATGEEYAYCKDAPERALTLDHFRAVMDWNEAK